MADNFDNFSGFDRAVVSETRIFKIMQSSQVRFDKFLTRASTWDRYTRSGKIMYIALAICTAGFLLLYIPFFVFYYRWLDKRFPVFQKSEYGFDASLYVQRKCSMSFADRVNVLTRTNVNNIKMRQEFETKVVEASDRKLKLEIYIVYNHKVELFADYDFELNETERTITMAQRQLLGVDWKNAICCAGTVAAYSVRGVYTYAPIA